MTSYDKTILSSQSHTPFRQQLCSSSYVLLQLKLSTKPRQHPIAPQNKWPRNTSLPMEGQEWMPLRQSFDTEMLKPRSVLSRYCKQNSVHLEMSLLATLCLKWIVNILSKNTGGLFSFWNARVIPFIKLLRSAGTSHFECFCDSKWYLLSRLPMVFLPHCFSLCLTETASWKLWSRGIWGRRHIKQFWQGHQLKNLIPPGNSLFSKEAMLPLHRLLQL